MIEQLSKRYIIVGCLLIAVSVVLGAFGAHGLKQHTQDQSILDIFDKATKYQLHHAWGIILLGLVVGRFPIQTRYIYILFLLGILCFSGSLYMITYLKIQSYDIPTAVALMTPFGGLCWIVAWLLFAWKLYKHA